MTMLCRDPYVDMAGRAFGCGQCMPCRMNKRRIWTHRMMLEAAQYADNAFVTLTYADEYLSFVDWEGKSQPTLVPKDLQDWLKRLRYQMSSTGRKFRFFAVGEYGDVTWRPHYHVALFNMPTCDYGQSRYKYRANCCQWCDLVRDTWAKGNVYLGTLENDSAGYMAGYVTKKLTRRDDTRLLGRHPEFARMSLRPGIGHSAMWEVADTMMLYRITDGDVPVSLRHGSRELPLGRYLRSRLREMTGKDPNAPQETLDELSAEMLPMRMAARASEENPSIKAHLIKAGDAKYLQMEKRSKIFKRGKTL